MPRASRHRVVSVRLTPSEHAAAQAEAQAAGAPLGAWLRLRMLEAGDLRGRLAAIEARLTELVAALADKPSIGQMQTFLDVYLSAAAKAKAAVAAPRPAAIAAPTTPTAAPRSTAQ